MCGRASLLETVLGLDLEKRGNALYLLTPWLLLFACGIAGGLLVDRAIERGDDGTARATTRARKAAAVAGSVLPSACCVGLAFVREVRGGGERDGREEGGHAAEEDGRIAARRLQHIVDAGAEDDAEAALQRKHNAERHAEEERALHREIAKHEHEAA